MSIFGAKKKTRHKFVFEVPAFLIQPLAPVLVGQPDLKVSNPDCPTWKISSSQLLEACDILWESLEPQSENILGNVTSPLNINNPALLPYCDHEGNQALFIENPPQCLVPVPKLPSSASPAC